MKTKIATAILTMASVLGFTEEAPIVQPSSALPLEVKPVEKVSSNNSFGYGYILMGVSDTDTIKTLETLPSIGLGYRFAVPSASIDVSANYTREFKEESYFYTVPKVSYLRYFSAAKEQSFYYGAGLAWGAVSKENVDFQGLVPSATVGFEMNRNAFVRSFVQLEVSQPAVHVASWKSYSISDLPAPIAQASVGLGF
jgi:hypothetical protein